MLTLTQGHLNIKIEIMVFSEITGFGNYCSLRPETLQMQTTCKCEYSRSRPFHDDLILQDQASGERSQDQWPSGLIFYLWIHIDVLNRTSHDIYQSDDHFLKSLAVSKNNGLWFINPFNSLILPVELTLHSIKSSFRCMHVMWFHDERPRNCSVIFGQR